MRIVVCVKAVPSTTEVKMDPETHTIVRDGRASVVNPFDASALEVALSLKQAYAQRDIACEVAVLSMGIPDTARLLRDCIARGADKALLLSDRAFAGADTLATTYALTCGIAELGGADIVLCGKMAVDGDTAQIGPEIAAALGIPCITDVREVHRSLSGTLHVHHGVDAGVEYASVPVPCVLTVAKEAAQLRMPSIPGVLAAEDTEVRVLTAADVDADPARIGLSGSPTQVVRSFVPEQESTGVEVLGTAEDQAKELARVIGEMAL